MTANCGNRSEKTRYYPIRLPHDLRADLDRAAKLTGQPR